MQASGLRLYSDVMRLPGDVSAYELDLGGFQ